MVEEHTGQTTTLSTSTEELESYVSYSIASKTKLKEMGKEHIKWHLEEGHKFNQWA